MCPEAYVNLLREKVRQLKIEQERISLFGPAPERARFVPWVPPLRPTASNVRDPSKLEMTFEE